MRCKQTVINSSVKYITRLAKLKLNYMAKWSSDEICTLFDIDINHVAKNVANNKENALRREIYRGVTLNKFNALNYIQFHIFH